MEKRSCKVCVTGSAGYVGSYLGYSLSQVFSIGFSPFLLKSMDFVTVSFSDDRTKVGLLRSFPNAETGLKLFQADIYNPDEFEAAIRGCEFLFHEATPQRHTEGSQYKNTTEAAVAAARSIATFCIQSGLVKQLIYTASLMAASPLMRDGSGFKDTIDESCWSTLSTMTSLPYANSFNKDYTESKMLAEKEILSYGSDSNGGLEVVTLACGLVGGDTVLTYMPGSVAEAIAQLTENPNHYQSLRIAEEFLGKIPVVHIEDVCEAHIFCMEKSSIQGRFFCSNSYISTAEMAEYYQKHYPEFRIKPKYLNIGPKRIIKGESVKLIEAGFEFKYDIGVILDDSINCGRKMGVLH